MVKKNTQKKQKTLIYSQDSVQVLPKSTKSKAIKQTQLILKSKSKQQNTTQVQVSFKNVDQRKETSKMIGVLQVEEHEHIDHQVEQIKSDDKKNQKNQLQKKINYQEFNNNKQEFIEWRRQELSKYIGKKFCQVKAELIKKHGFPLINKYKKQLSQFLAYNKARKSEGIIKEPIQQRLTFEQSDMQMENEVLQNIQNQWNFMKVEMQSFNMACDIWNENHKKYENQSDKAWRSERANTNTIGAIGGAFDFILKTPGNFVKAFNVKEGIKLQDSLINGWIQGPGFEIETLQNEVKELKDIVQKQGELIQKQDKQISSMYTSVSSLMRDTYKMEEVQDRHEIQIAELQNTFEQLDEFNPNWQQTAFSGIVADAMMERIIEDSVEEIVNPPVKKQVTFAEENQVQIYEVVSSQSEVQIIPPRTNQRIFPTTTEEEAEIAAEAYFNHRVSSTIDGVACFLAMSLPNKLRDFFMSK